MSAPLRVFVEATDPDLVRRLRDDASRAGWTLVTRVDEADVVVRAARPRDTGARPPTVRAASATGAAWEADDLPHEALTPRELDVLRLVAQGLANKQIASRLGISERTVKGHLGRVFREIGVADRTSAALWARENLPDA